MATLHLQLVTPQRLVLNEEIDSLSCPTTQGQITILPGHIPLVSTLISGELIARNGETEHNIHVVGGFVQVKPGNNIIILADAAEHHYEIDIERAELARVQAAERLALANISDHEYATAAASLQRNLSRILIARKHSHRRTQPITNQATLKQ